MMRRIRHSLVMLAMIGFAVYLAGCSSGNDQQTFDPVTGMHPPGWADPTAHGATTKSRAAGFSSCQECHGAGYAGGLSAVSCFTCHGVQAPHAPAPWRGGVRTHTNTAEGNAAVCAQCHTNGENSSVRPSQAPPAGTAPGCFNNTLCHATPGHPVGWSDPAQHGASAKSQPNGFSLCQSCHGSNFTGGTALVSCFTCHGVSAPHSPKPWRGGARTHTNTDQGNAAVCVQCHANGANSSVQPSPPATAGTPPGCFNNTLCHATAGHPAGWSDPTQHGVAAEQDFSACKTCHGQTYQGGSATTTCYQCHNGPGLNHPAPSWVVLNHKTAAVSNSVVCQECHGADYLGGGSHIACKSCHMEDRTKVHMLVWYPDVQANHRAYALANGTVSCANQYCHGTTLTGVAQSGPSCSTCHTWPFTGGSCGSCHALPPAGSTFPNIAGSHSPHTVLGSYIDCNACHTGAGSGTALHQNGTADVAFATTYNAKSGAPAFNSTTNTCSNISCHGSSRTQTSTQANATPPQSTPGQTPVWGSGTINVNTQCTTCHVLGASAGSPENNSYFSGRHLLHVYSQGKACTVCHDTTKLAVNHFTTLNTAAMEGPASATLATALNYNGTSCNPSAGGLTGCHSSENWR